MQIIHLRFLQTLQKLPSKRGAVVVVVGEETTKIIIAAAAAAAVHMLGQI
ncbi:MAG: hypothetical protein LAT57_05315 [Balneolales bacterium]|nr:hypothetical protein [Balneolales bacterium]